MRSKPRLISPGEPFHHAVSADGHRFLNAVGAPLETAMVLIALLAAIHRGPPQLDEEVLDFGGALHICRRIKFIRIPMRVCPQP